MTKRQPDSKAVAAARVELTAIVDELRAIRTRTLALSRRLKRAARTGDVLGTIFDDLFPDGQPYTAEDWFAGSLWAESVGNESYLRESIRFLAGVAREDHRKMARSHIRCMRRKDAA